MTNSTHRIALFLLACTAAAQAQFQPPPPRPATGPGTYEEPPNLDAATILRPEFVAGAHFRLRPLVLTYGGHNQYLIDSDFGVFDATGNTELVIRIQEIEAIAKLRDISRTDAYKKALEKAAKSPVEMAKDLAENPVKTITGVPKGVWKFLNRAGESVKEAAQDRERSPYEERAGADLIGFSKAKREMAAQLGVDPYSSNEVLQKELNGISWAGFAGSMTLNLALAPVGGGAGAVITGINASETARGVLRDKSPNDIRRIALDQILGMTIPRETASAFLNNPAYSPTNQMLLVDALLSLPGVAGRDEFLSLATEATDETDALFFRRTAQLLARVHGEKPLQRLSTTQGFPVAQAQDGNLVLALEWDYACWTHRAAAFLQNLKTGMFGSQKITGHQVFITGVASPKTRDELTANNIQLTEKALPGPLR